MPHQKAQRKPSEFVKFAVVDLEGRLYDLDPESHAECELFHRPEA